MSSPSLSSSLPPSLSSSLPPSPSPRATPPLSQQRVLITGAASGLGRALAIAFGQAGATLALVDINLAGLRETAKSLPQASLYQADLSDATSTRRMIAAVRADHVRIDTLIHDAAYLVPQSFADCSEESWRLTFNVGIEAAYLMTKAFWADWLRDGATAIYVSSRSGIEGFIDETAYCTTKHAIEGMVKCLGMEATLCGIMTHTVTPGWYMHTPLSERLYTADLKSKWVDPIALAPAFLYLALRPDPTLSGQRLNAWELSERVRNGSLCLPA